MTAPVVSTGSVIAAGVSAPSWWRVLSVGAVTIACAHALDSSAWTHVRDAQIYERDWGRLLRITGFLPTWFIVAAAMRFHDGASNGWKSRAGVMALAPTIGGVLAELLKLLLRRMRPGTASPEYVFRSFLVDPFSNRGMGMPSSHVLVAMAAATVLARLYPRVRWLWYALAAGCAYTRVAAGAHYLSDTAVAAVVGWLVGDAVIKWATKNKPPEALAPGGLDVPLVH